MMNDPDDSNSFLLELSSFLKELGCPYKRLVIGKCYCDFYSFVVKILCKILSKYLGTPC